MLNILAYPYCFLAYPTNSTYLWSKPVSEIRFAGRAPLILVCATATWVTFWKSLCHRTTAPHFGDKNSRFPKCAPLCHIFQKIIAHNFYFFTKVTCFLSPVSCLASPVLLFLSHVSCLTSPVLPPVSCILSYD